MAACADTGSDKPLAAIGHITAQTLTSPLLKIGKLRTPHNAQLAREIARHIVRPGYNLEIAVGLGGSTQPPSLRLLAYLAPLLELGQSFADAEVTQPKLRVVAAHEVSSSTNGLDPDIARARALQAGQVLTRLSRLYSSDVRPSFEHQSMQDLLDHGLLSDAEHLQQLIDKPGPHMEKLQKLLQRATSKHASTEDSDEQKRILATYVAAHGLSFHNYRHSDVHGTIKLGGQGESPFDAMQQYMAERALQLGEHVTNSSPEDGTQQVTLRMHAGVIPPYYLESPFELTVETSSETVPDTASQAAELYHAHGLRSNTDFHHVPDRMSQTMKDYLL
jgi:hypothetical protein